MKTQMDGLITFGVHRLVYPPLFLSRRMKLMGSDRWNESHAKPKQLSIEQLHELTNAFVAATKRALEAGVDFIEIHGAHGYLIHSFVSPATNTRTDEYGGKSLENRIRWPIEVTRAIRKTIPSTMPLLYRISGTDWLPEGQGWDIHQTVEYAKRLAEEGVDLLDVSSGGNHKDQKIPSAPGFQVPLAAAVKKEVPNLLVGAVGLITNGKQANEVCFSLMDIANWASDFGEWKCGCDICGSRVPERSQFCIESGFRFGS